LEIFPAFWATWAVPRYHKTFLVFISPYILVKIGENIFKHKARLSKLPLTLSNPIFMPTACPQLLFVWGGKEVGGLLVIILQF
jgi:hypothetical protein